MQPLTQIRRRARGTRRALGSFLLALAGAWLASPAQAQVTLTLSSWVPPGNVLTETQKQWCAMLEQKVPGQVKCQALPRAVSSPPGTFDAVRNGLADLSFTVHGYTPGRFVTTQVAEFPFLGASAEATSVALQRLYQRSPAMAEEHRGVKVLTLFTHGPGMVFNTRRAIAGIDELQGLKFRIGGGVVHEVARALSMNVTLKPAPESFELLSTGVLDGTLFPAESVEAFKIDRLVRHATVFPGGFYNTSFVFFMNEKRYESLPPAVRQAVDELSGEFAARLIGRAWDRVDRRGMAYMQAAGVQFTQADAGFVKAVREKTAPLVDGWVKAAEAKGMQDPRKALNELRADVARLQ